MNDVNTGHYIHSFCTLGLLFASSRLLNDGSSGFKTAQADTGRRGVAQNTAVCRKVRHTLGKLLTPRVGWAYISHIVLAVSMLTT